MKELQAIDGMNTEELFAHAYAQLRNLKNLVTTRRKKDKAFDLLTEYFLIIEEISRRMSKLTFSEGPVVVDEEEDQPTEEKVPMADLFPAENDEEAEYVDIDRLDDIDDLRRMVRELKRSRLDYYRLFLDYLTKGCRHEIDVTKQVLAITRRVRPQSLQLFGLSQADVGRKLGQGRAAVSAREKEKVEKPLRASGAKGILSNGARGQATSQACARAAKGNQNRRAKGKRGKPD